MGKTDFADSVKREIGLNIEENNLFYSMTIHLYGCQEKIEKAEKIGKEFIKKDKDNQLFWSFLGYSYYIEARFGKAIECFCRRIEINPSNPYYWIELSFALRSNGELEISDWINFNLELFALRYQRSGYNHLNKQVLYRIKEDINKDLIKK